MDNIEEKFMGLTKKTPDTGYRMWPLNTLGGKFSSKKETDTTRIVKKVGDDDPYEAPKKKKKGFAEKSKAMNLQTFFAQGKIKITEGVNTMSVLDKIDGYLNEKEEKAKDDVKSKIFAFFKDNPNPPDEKIHDLADELGINPHKFEAAVYGILGSFMSKGRFNESGKDESDLPSDQLEMGIKIEMEHTDDPDIARRIACDHLAEFPDYYTRLKKMEDEAKKTLGEAVVTDRMNSLKGLQKQLEFEQNRQKTLTDPKQKEMGKKRIESIKKGMETIKNSMK